MPILEKAQDLLEKVGDKLSKKQDSDTTQTDNVTTTTATPTTNTITHDNPASTNHGPHSSNVANKVDPKVDSDLDGKHGHAHHQAHHQHHQHHAHHDSAVQVSGPAGTTASIDNPQSTNAGPHSSNTMNKLDPRVDSDRDGRNDPASRTGEFGQTQTATNTTVSPTSHNTATTTSAGSTNPAFDNPQSTNTGPHGSNVMNKLDPRVDSDRDGRNDPTSTTGGFGQTQTGSSAAFAATPASHNTATTTPAQSTNVTHDNPQSTNAGPHSNNLMNKLDPRVDSDRDGRNDPTSRTGGFGQTQISANTTATPTAYDSTQSTTVTHDNPQSTNAGPHSSNLMNKLDPRVDSDRDGRNDPTSRTGGYGQTQTGVETTATPATYDSTRSTNVVHDNPQSTNTGPHSNNMMNKLDPRVDSDRDGRNDPTSRTGGFGQTQTTANTTATPTAYDSTRSSNIAHDNPQSTNAGPHSSNLMNKLDPRVDSDRDGRNDPTSRTGGLGNTQDSYGTSASTHHTATATHDPSVAPASVGTTTSNTTFNNPSSTTTTTTTTDGPHNSDLMNKLDPRVDSDRGMSSNQTSNVSGYSGNQPHQAGFGTSTVHDSYGSGTTSSDLQHDNPQSTNAGPHGSNIMNKLDPRVDSNRDGQTQPMTSTGGYSDNQHYTHHTGPGLSGGDGNLSNDPRSTNDGPHSSNILNKLDPRVDSSGTDGQNVTSGTRTYAQTQTGAF